MFTDLRKSVMPSCALSTANMDLLVALVQITYCVGHGVLAALDVRTSALEFVWKNDTAFLKHPQLSFLTFEYLYTEVKLTLPFVEDVVEHA